MPNGITATVSGQSEEMQASFVSMQFALALAVFLVYLVMASQFESLIHPFVILFTIPLALVGAVLALFVTGTTVNIVALIGVIMLAGIVVNNAIVLVDLINQLRAQGMSRHDAILEAGSARLRPILMTSLTTALGLLPMALGLGEGAEVRAPMAITVIGGLLVSTLLTLVVIPVVYSLLDRKEWPAAAAVPATRGTVA
jgi:HAE1 family hydrophobic/amphiphilic exporter-1